MFFKLYSSYCITTASSTDLPTTAPTSANSHARPGSVSPEVASVSHVINQTLEGSLSIASLTATGTAIPPSTTKSATNAPSAERPSETSTEKPTSAHRMETLSNPANETNKVIKSTNVATLHSTTNSPTAHTSMHQVPHAQIPTSPFTAPAPNSNESELSTLHQSSLSNHNYTNGEDISTTLHPSTSTANKSQVNLNLFYFPKGQHVRSYIFKCDLMLVKSKRFLF